MGKRNLTDQCAGCGNVVYCRYAAGPDRLPACEGCIARLNHPATDDATYWPLHDRLWPGCDCGTADPDEDRDHPGIDHGPLVAGARRKPW